MIIIKMIRKKNFILMVDWFFKGYYLNGKGKEYDEYGNLKF